MTLPASNGRAQQPLEHAEVGFNLPALPVSGNGPLIAKSLPEETSRLLSRHMGRTSPLRRNDPHNAQLLVKKLMVAFPIVANVSQQCVERMSAMGLSRNTVEFNIVRLGPAINDHAEEQVRFDVDDR